MNWSIGASHEASTPSEIDSPPMMSLDRRRPIDERAAPRRASAEAPEVGMKRPPFDRQVVRQRGRDQRRLLDVERPRPSCR